MAVRRGTTNRNVRGSAKGRRARKQWLLDTFGDGVTAPCSHCGKALTFETLTQDRIIPGFQGGTYVRSNLRPACLPCNSSQGALAMWAARRALEG